MSFVTQQYYTAVDDRTRELEQRIVTSIDSPLLGLLGAHYAIVSAPNSGGTRHCDSVVLPLSLQARTGAWA